MKQLQERVKELENQNKRKIGDSIIFMKKSQACTNEETTISCSGHEFKKEQLPKVEARVLEKEILIGIHCEKQKDIVLRLMALLQNLHLSLASSSVLPFGTSTLKVTIIAQVNYTSFSFSKTIYILYIIGSSTAHRMCCVSVNRLI